MASAAPCDCVCLLDRISREPSACFMHPKQFVRLALFIAIYHIACCVSIPDKSQTPKKQRSGKLRNQRRKPALEPTITILAEFPTTRLRDNDGAEASGQPALEAESAANRNAAGLQKQHVRGLQRKQSVDSRPAERSAGQAPHQTM
jgi:hypothetical protein